MADDLHNRMENTTTRAFDRQRHLLERERERLRAFNPQQTLARGFALITNSKKETVTHTDALQTGDTVTIRFFDGSVNAEVTGKDSK